MPLEIEVRGATVAEALSNALEQLGRDEDEVAFKVLSQTPDGVVIQVTTTDDADELDDLDDLDLEEAPARPPSRRRRPPPSLEVLASSSRALLEELLVQMSIDGFVTPVTQTAEGRDGEPEHSIILHIEGVDEETTGLIIGRRGETLRSLQYLVNLLIHRRLGYWPQVVIDIGHYRQRRQDSLEGLAHRMAERARQSGRPVPLEPMSAFERRVIHMALRNDDSVYTESSGEGEQRKIVIFPTKH